MKIVSPPAVHARNKTYNEEHEFTRRIPTYLTQKQRERDSKIVTQIGKAYDVEQDLQKVMDIFMNKCRLLSNTAYWEVLRTVWLICGSTKSIRMFLPYFRSGRGARSWFMTMEDAKALEEMDFPKMLYRAYDDEDDKGISWTSDKEWCEEFARHWGKKVKTQVFERDDIFAYLSRRGEEEFLILPKQ